jgi:hypothetical protein
MNLKAALALSALALAMLSERADARRNQPTVFVTGTDQHGDHLSGYMQRVGGDYVIGNLLSNRGRMVHCTGYTYERDSDVDMAWLLTCDDQGRLMTREELEAALREQERYIDAEKQRIAAEQRDLEARKRELERKLRD